MGGDCSEDGVSLGETWGQGSGQRGERLPLNCVPQIPVLKP